MKKIIIAIIILLIIILSAAYKVVLDNTNKKIELLAKDSIQNQYHPDPGKLEEIYTEKYLDEVKGTELYNEIYNEELIKKIKEKEKLSGNEKRYEILYVQINENNIFKDKYFVSVRIKDILDEDTEYFKNIYITKVGEEFLIYNVETDIWLRNYKWRKSLYY